MSISRKIAGFGVIFNPSRLKFDHPPTRQNTVMATRTSGVREKWVDNRDHREYWCTIYCNSEGLGKGLVAARQSKVLPSSCGRYRISSMMCPCADPPHCHFFLARRDGDGDNDDDDSDNSEYSDDSGISDEDSDDEDSDNHNGADITFRLYITHPADENLNVAGNSIIPLKIPRLSKSPQYPPRWDHQVESLVMPRMLSFQQAPNTNLNISKLLFILRYNLSKGGSITCVGANNR